MSLQGGDFIKHVSNFSGPSLEKTTAEGKFYRARIASSYKFSSLFICFSRSSRSRISCLQEKPGTTTMSRAVYCIGVLYTRLSLIVVSCVNSRSSNLSNKANADCNGVYAEHYSTHASLRYLNEGRLDALSLQVQKESKESEMR